MLNFLLRVWEIQLNNTSWSIYNPKDSLALFFLISEKPPSPTKVVDDETEKAIPRQEDEVEEEKAPVTSSPLSSPVKVDEEVQPKTEGIIQIEQDKIDRATFRVLSKLTSYYIIGD